MAFSVSRELREGRCVLLTGATGFVGSLVLEQLLRCTRAKVYVLIRGKRGASTTERLQRLLSKPLFAKHMSDKAAQEDAAARVVAVHGDIQASGLGMARDTLELMQREVHFFIHAAADVALDRHVQDSLRCNYCSTAAVLEVAGSMCSLRSFVYVSSAFVSVHLARGSVVQEQLYGLLGTSKQNGRTAYTNGTTHQLFDEHAAGQTSALEIVEQLLALPPIQAEAEGKLLLATCGFPNTYTLSKHLAEKLVAQHYAETGLPIVIVRPSVVTCTALAPYAGYLGNWAGLSVWVLAHLVGLFNCLWSSGWAADGVVDIIPGDFCASAIIVAAAATSAGTTEQINPASGEEPLIIHSATSGCQPLPTHVVWDTMVAFNDTHTAPFCLRAGRLPVSVNFPDYKPHLGLLALVSWLTKLKLDIVCAVLRALGQRHAATRLKMMYEGWRVVNNPNVDKSLTFRTDNLSQLQRRMEVDEQATTPLLFDASWMSWDKYLPTCFNAVFCKAGFDKKP